MWNIACVEVVRDVKDRQTRFQCRDLLLGPLRMNDYAFGVVEDLSVQRQQEFLKTRERIVLSLLR